MNEHREMTTLLQKFYKHKECLNRPTEAICFKIGKDIIPLYGHLYISTTFLLPWFPLLLPNCTIYVWSTQRTYYAWETPYQSPSIWNLGYTANIEVLQIIQQGKRASRLWDPRTVLFIISLPSHWLQNLLHFQALTRKMLLSGFSSAT